MSNITRKDIVAYGIAMVGLGVLSSLLIGAFILYIFGQMAGWSMIGVAILFFVYLGLTSKEENKLFEKIKRV
jgi:hypothetical protein